MPKKPLRKNLILEIVKYHQALQQRHYKSLQLLQDVMESFVPKDDKLYIERIGDHIALMEDKNFTETIEFVNIVKEIKRMPRLGTKSQNTNSTCN